MNHCVLVPLLLLLAIFNGCFACQKTTPTPCLTSPTKAVCVLAPHGGNSNVTGTITLQQSGNSLKITGTVKALNANQKHGFHAHQYGDVSTCTAAGGHFNPFGKDHGAPTDENRHVGDWGNIQANAEGVATVDITDTVASLQTENTVLGRAIVVHAGTDDLGRGGHPDSKTTGNAGARMACCVIGLAAT